MQDKTRNLHVAVANRSCVSDAIMNNDRATSLYEAHTMLHQLKSSQLLYEIESEKACNKSVILKATQVIKLVLFDIRLHISCL